MEERISELEKKVAELERQLSEQPKEKEIILSDDLAHKLKHMITSLYSTNSAKPPKISEFMEFANEFDKLQDEIGRQKMNEKLENVKSEICNIIKTRGMSVHEADEMLSSIGDSLKYRSKAFGE